VNLTVSRLRTTSSGLEEKVFVAGCLSSVPSARLRPSTSTPNSALPFSADQEKVALVMSMNR
jgi:hypothetical protein